MPRYIITFPDETITHDGLIKIEGGVLSLLDGSRFRAAFIAGQWLEVKEGDYTPRRDPIPQSNNAMRVLFEGDNLNQLGQLARRWAAEPDAAAIRAVTEALAALAAARAA